MTSPIRNTHASLSTTRPVSRTFLDRISHAILASPVRAASTLTVITFLVFLPAVNCDFVNWDDDCYVYDNPLILDGLSPAGVRGAFTNVVFCNWAPLTILSYQLDATLFGKEPWGFHLTNVLLHATSAACLFLVLVRMTGCPGRSITAALLFALHPLRVESVAWIAERKDCLSVLFVVIALLAYEWYCRRPDIWRYSLVFAAMLASLLSKATAVTLPGLLLLLDVWPMGRLSAPGIGRPVRGDGALLPYPSRPSKDLVIEKLPLIALAVVFAVVTLRTQQEAIQTEVDMPFWRARLPNALCATTWYVAKTFWPSGLYPVYRHTGIDDRPIWLVLGCTAACASLAGVAAVTARRVPAVTIGMVWFTVSLLPVLGLVAQQGFQSHADRFTYVPHVGLLVAIVWGGWEIANRLRCSPGFIASGVVLAVSACAVRCESQLPIWHNSESLWNHVLALDPRSPVAHYNLGRALDDRGHSEAAAARYHQALVVDPAWLPARNNLAAILIERGEITEARPHVERALRGERDPLTFINLCRLLVAEDKPLEAAEAAREAIAIDGSNAAAYFVYGRALAAQALLEQAIDAYAHAVRIDPDHIQARNNLANLLARLRRFNEAIPLYRSIIERDPNAEVAQRNLAAALRDQARGAASETNPRP